MVWMCAALLSSCMLPAMSGRARIPPVRRSQFDNLGGLWTLYEDKMRADRLPTAAIDAFHNNFAFLLSGLAATIPEDSISPVETLPRYDNLGLKEQHALLSKTVMVKLNGGLGTGMGLNKAKSLLVVKEGYKFLDIIALQVESIAGKFGVDLKFMAMNSFSTSVDTLAEFAKYPGLGSVSDLELLQYKVPKVRVADLKPASWPARPVLEWCPPGHGDLFSVLYGSGALKKLINSGYKYMFSSNSDNLGATLDLRLLTHFANFGSPFLMEVAERTDADKKGGHVAWNKSSQSLLLRDLAQCDASDVDDFQNVTKHRFFNTNNLWIDLVTLNETLALHGGVLPLPVIVNNKTIDPRDKTSTPVYQLETGTGSAIVAFDGSSAVVVPRSRFAPVKTTNDLFVLRSDAYVLTHGNRVVLAHRRNGKPPVVELDPMYKFVDQMDALVANGVPSLIECDRLEIKGDMEFENGVVIKGRVVIRNHGEKKTVRAGIYKDDTFAV